MMIQKKYSYNSLNQISDNIASIILSTFQNKPSAIGLLFGHEANMIFSIIGVLKSNHYYVPLDIEYPFERLIYILNDKAQVTRSW